MPASRRIAALGVAALLALGAHTAVAAEGCDSRVMSAMNAAAQARHAFNKSIDDEIFDQDDSVLALTCFNRFASIMAQRTGAVFSGNFFPPLASVVDDALIAHYANYRTYSTGGGVTGVVDYSMNASTMIPFNDGDAPITHQCDQMVNLWREVLEEGNKLGAPFLTMDDLRYGNADGLADPAAKGANFRKSWISRQSQATFDTLHTAAVGLPGRSNLGPTETLVVDDTTAPEPQTPCEILKASHALPDTTVCPTTP